LPDAWNNKPVTEPHQPEDSNGILERWWTSFNDPLLTSMIEKAVKGNKDLKQSEAKLKEARAQRDMAISDRFPTISASGSASRRRSSGETGLGRTTELYDAGFDASWELDLFGGKRRAQEAAEATLEASSEDMNDLMVSLTAEVGINYLEAISYQGRLAIARETLLAQQQSYDIAGWRRQAGLVTQLDEDQALAALQQTRSQIPTLEMSLEQSLNRLAILLGERPGWVHRSINVNSRLPSLPADPVAGIPADLLRRRPDIRRAERQIAAATARVGVATAARYPSFSLTGTIGLEALSTGNLFTANARTWALALSPLFNLFDAGRKRAGLDAANAQLEQAMQQLGEKPFRGRQLHKWLYLVRQYDFSLMTEIGRASCRERV